MSDPIERAARASCGVALACLAAGFVLFAGPSAAQEQGTSPLRLLKPWIERQLFGRATSPGDAQPADEGAAEPAGPDERPPASPEPASEASATSPLPDTAIAAPAGPGADGATEGAPMGAVSPADGAPTGDGPPDSITTILQETAEPKPEVLRFGVLAGRSPVATMAAVTPMAEALKASLGRPVEILPLGSFAAMIDAQVQRRIDGGFFSTAAYLDADRLCTCLEPLVAPRAEDGTSSYRAIIVARADSGILRPADLGGKHVAVGPPDSIGTRRVQLAGLLADGIDPATTFAGVVEVDSADEAVRLVLRGRVDAAFAWSSLSGSPEGGYSRGVLADLVRDGDVAARSLVIVWRSPPIGHGPFAASRTLAEGEKAKIKDYLLQLAETNSAAYDLLDPLYGGGFAAVDARDYSGLQALLAERIDALDLSVLPSTTGAVPLAPPSPDGSSAAN